VAALSDLSLRLLIGCRASGRGEKGEKKKWSGSFLILRPPTDTSPYFFRRPTCAKKGEKRKPPSHNFSLLLHLRERGEESDFSLPGFFFCNLTYPPFSPLLYRCVSYYLDIRGKEKGGRKVALKCFAFQILGTSLIVFRCTGGKERGGKTPMIAAKQRLSRALF